MSGPDRRKPSDGAGLRMILEAQDDLEVVGEAGDGEHAVELAPTLVPDVVLVDIRMPVVDGIEATLWGARTRSSCCGEFVFANQTRGCRNTIVLQIPISYATIEYLHPTRFVERSTSSQDRRPSYRPSRGGPDQLHGLMLGGPETRRPTE